MASKNIILLKSIFDVKKNPSQRWKVAPSGEVLKDAVFLQYQLLWGQVPQSLRSLFPSHKAPRCPALAQGLPLEGGWEGP